MGASVRLTPRGWTTLAAAVALGLAWWPLGLRDIWYLAAVLGATVTISVLTAGLAALAARFSVTLSASTPTPTAGDPMVLTVQVSHRMPFAQHLAAVIRLGEAAHTLDATVPARRGLHVRVDATAPRRGPTRATVTHLVSRDPLGLAEARLHPRASADLLVLPRLLDIPALLPAERVIEDDRGADGRAHRRAYSGHPGGAVRQYRTGDALRQIHWKQSARQGEMLVNMPEGERETESELLLLTWWDGYRSNEEFDLAVSAAATLGWSWIRHERTVRLHVGRERESFVDEGLFLRALALVEPDEDYDEAATEVTLSGSVTVVAGTITRRVHRQLFRIRPGEVLAIRHAMGIDVPAGWRYIPLPEPGGGSDG